MKKQPPISDQLRQAIRQSGLSQYEISKRTGVDQAVLSKFLHGLRGIGLASIDALGECLGLRLVAEGRPKRKKERR